ncbi:MAG: hypothetical protein RLZZ08_1170 [Pseudomonadota bacterium]|jgi:mono/diheme cytochrome c family protein
MNRALTIAFAALAMAGCAAAAQDAKAPAAAPVAPAAPVAAKPPAGPPPMPKPITLASRPGVTGGEAMFVEHCAQCHGPNGMGTGLLGRRVQPAMLEQRDNLAAAYVVMAARRGVGNMPAIPRGEVSDADLKLIADYLAAGPHGVAK